MGLSWYSKKWVNILLHVSAWLLLFSLPFLLRPSINNRPAGEDQHTGLALIRYVLNDLMFISLFYLNAQVLIPKFIYRRRYRDYALILVLAFPCILFIAWLLFFKLLKMPGFNISGHILFNFFFFLFFLAGSTAYRMIKDRTRTDRIAREKENENLKTELSLLRSQASPHFMFNVLNNMVALARKKSDLLEPSLLKFSALMRYMLYETDAEKVPLEKEIEYLQSYIDLQQQRFGKNVEIKVDMHPEGHYEIEPMLLIPFVENAFKHGTGMIEQAQIRISLATANDKLSFMVTNKFDPVSLEVKDKTSGIGLANVRRRLNLLYGDMHRLKIDRNDSWFTVSLQLNLQ
jgi:sensor histidine kinase YesM